MHEDHRQQVLDELPVSHIVKETEEDTDDQCRRHTLVGVERGTDNRREHQHRPFVLLIDRSEQTEEVELLIECVQKRINDCDTGERRKLRDDGSQIDVTQALCREIVVAVVKNHVQDIRAETHDEEEDQILRNDLEIKLERNLLKVKVTDEEIDEDNGKHLRLKAQVARIGSAFRRYLGCCLRNLRRRFRDRRRRRFNRRLQGVEVHLRGDDNELPEENQGDDDDIEPSEVLCLLSREDNVANVHTKLPPL